MNPVDVSINSKRTHAKQKWDDINQKKLKFANGKQ